MLDPLYTLISWVLLTYHHLLSLVLPETSGINWALSIVLLVLTTRALLFPLFVKQIKSQRRMQAIQPQMKLLREKHKNDRETLNREMSTLLRENNANPLTGCLPMLVQIPVFMSLFHVLRWVTYSTSVDNPLYGWTSTEVANCAGAKLLGAPIGAAFNTPLAKLDELGATQTAVHVVTGAFIALMAITTFLTQRQMLARTKATSEAQVQTVQKTLMYIIPVSLVVSGPFFPLGVLIYWTTTNLFSLGQQQYVIRTMHEAEERKRLAQIEAKSNPAISGPRPGVKPVNPKKTSAKPTTTGGAAPGSTAPGTNSSGTAANAPKKTQQGGKKPGSQGGGGGGGGSPGGGKAGHGGSSGQRASGGGTGSSDGNNGGSR